MPKTRINCPNCRQSIIADVEQLFDVGEDPSAKAKLLSGGVNFVQCPNCGYQGNLATPIVYHDPQKELLLTYVPAELGLPHDDQERLLGQLINQAVNRLKPEQRKAYILRPQAHFTLQGLIQRILESDGITPEMLQAQQQKLSLLQRLLTASDRDVQVKIIQQEDQSVDGDLFNILTRLMETASASGDQESVAQLEDLRTLLIENSKFGQQIQKQTAEVQAAIQSLQQLGSDLTREKLLDLIINAPNDTRRSALVSLTRPGMDYEFFQLLTDRIEKAGGEQRETLTQLREQLLDLTKQIDQQIEVRSNQARQLLNSLLTADNIPEATAQNLPVIDDFFLQILTSELEQSRKAGDLEKMGKLQQIASVVQQASAPPPEIEFIEELLDASDEPSRRELLEAHRDEITPEFLQLLSGLVNQVIEANQEPELIERLKSVNRQVLRFSMEVNLRGESV
jgi:hypothetical protein